MTESSEPRAPLERGAWPRCSEPGCQKIALFLCDQPVAGGLCRRDLCYLHAATIGPDCHVCPTHARGRAPRRSSTLQAVAAGREAHVGRA